VSYTDFTLEILREQFGIHHQFQKLFTEIKPVFPSDLLEKILLRSQHIPLKSEKAKSEFIIAHVLADIQETNNDMLTLLSGETFNVDKDRGLCGECDFLFIKDPRAFVVTAPVLSVIEAKKGDIEAGIHQCSAQLCGIKIYNEKHNASLSPIYGCVTIGTEWKFLRLEDNMVTVDTDIYYLNQLPDILGVFQAIMDTYK
jgi:hypothetical protein